jgi:hypothetical protein
MNRHPFLLLSLLAALACTPTPSSGGDDDDDDDDNGGSSSGAVGTSSGRGQADAGLPTGVPIPMEQLCATLAQGYARTYVSYIFGLSDALLCTSAPDSLVQEVFYADAQTVVDAFCTSADGGGFMFNVVRDLARSEQQGRLRYHADRAGSCVALGRQTIAARGLVSLYGNRLRDAGALPDYPEEGPCEDAVEGLVPVGGACQWNFECAQDADGESTVCSARTGTDCTGVCRARARVGQECESRGNPPCASNLTCLRPGGGPGVCAAAAEPSRMCKVDGGTLACQEGVCRGGICGDPFPAGTGCTSTSECAAGLACFGDPPRCQVRLGQGAPCGSAADGGTDLPCAECLWCTSTNGQPATCLPSAKEGQSCAQNPCDIGLACVAGTCSLTRVLGESCTTPDNSEDPSIQGTCRQSALGVCRKPAHLPGAGTRGCGLHGEHGPGGVPGRHLHG